MKKQVRNGFRREALRKIVRANRVIGVADRVGDSVARDVQSAILPFVCARRPSIWLMRVIRQLKSAPYSALLGACENDGGDPAHQCIDLRRP